MSGRERRGGGAGGTIVCSVGMVREIRYMYVCFFMMCKAFGLRRRSLGMNIEETISAGGGRGACAQIFSPSCIYHMYHGDQRSI